MHIDGYNLLPFLTVKGEKSPRKGFIYFSDDGDLVAVRAGNWKAVFVEQRAKGTLEIWAEPFTVLRVPKLYNLRTDPFERADITSNTYWDWYFSKAYMIMAAQAIVAAVPRDRSKTTRRARRPRPSPSIRRWRRWRSPSTAATSGNGLDKAWNTHRGHYSNGPMWKTMLDTAKSPRSKRSTAVIRVRDGGN